MTSKIEIVERDYPEIADKVDYALPIDYVRRLAGAMGEDTNVITSNFVYSYHNDRIFGELFPITEKGREILERINKLVYIQDFWLSGQDAIDFDYSLIETVESNMEKVVEELPMVPLENSLNVWWDRRYMNDERFAYVVRYRLMEVK